MASEKKTWNKWTQDEERKLMKGLEKGNLFEDLQKELPGRSIIALRLRALKIAREEIGSSNNTEEVLDKYGLDVDDYKKYLADTEIQKENAKLKKEENKKPFKKYIDELKAEIDELRGRIVKLESKKKSSKK